MLPYSSTTSARCMRVTCIRAKRSIEDIDGGTYQLYTRNTTGTGGSKCGSSVTSWAQFYSIRKTARTCGQLRLFAGLAEEGSWVDARIDHADPERKPLPKPHVI